MIRLIASLSFVLKSAWQNFCRNLGVSLASVFTMGLILFLVGGVVLLTHSIDTLLSDQQAKASKIRVYIKDGISLASITSFEQQLLSDPRVLSASFESKDKAAEEASKTDPNFQQALSVLNGSNPLPASINLDVRKLSDLGEINDTAKANPLVDPVNTTDYNPELITKLQRYITYIDIGGLVLAAILALISLVIIMNTIRTAVHVRRVEIEIMKLVGATDWFVRWPFIVEGILGGVFAAIFAGAVVAGAYQFFVNEIRGRILLNSLPYDGSFLVLVLVILTFAGICLGALGSFLGVRRFLSV